MQNFGYSMLWYWLGYLFATVCGILHTVFNIYVRHMKSMDAHSMGEGYERTKPFHPLYNIILFSISAWLYLGTLSAPTVTDALLTGLVWAGITIVFDLVAWVLVKHPWHLSFHEFYVGYQPWISLIYLAILLSPLTAYGITALVK